MQQHIWHPCSQMKDYEIFKPVRVVGANGCYIELDGGRKIIDAISSWWCKSLGHQHPRLKKAIQKQMDQFEHVILANTTNETIENLAQQLSRLLPTLNKVFFASDGACAIEIALKMSLHSRVIKGDKKKQNFFSLTNSYHGDTVGALSVSDLGIYRDPYQRLLFQTHYLSPLPYVSGAMIHCGLIVKNIGSILKDHSYITVNL